MNYNTVIYNKESGRYSFANTPSGNRGDVSIPVTDIFADIYSEVKQRFSGRASSTVTPQEGLERIILKLEDEVRSLARVLGDVRDRNDLPYIAFYEARVQNRQADLDKVKAQLEALC